MTNNSSTGHTATALTTQTLDVAMSSWHARGLCTDVYFWNWIAARHFPQSMTEGCASSYGGCEGEPGRQRPRLSAIASYSLASTTHRRDGIDSVIIPV